ncbi:MAG: hypothetical protein IJR07_09010 [Bacteroidaceae bacterium]|nr:hypothetical protein [Bacteroidaceae bacterium]
MKKSLLWLFAVLFAFVCSTTLLSSCSKDKDEQAGFPEKQIEPSPAQQPTVTVVVEGGEDEVTESLKKSPGLVRIRKEVRTEKAGEMANIPVYFCYFTQLVDHKDPSKGTFEQKVAITMNYPFSKGEPVFNILHTQGYNTPDTADAVWTTSMHFPLLNEVQVEYRYFGTSLPEPFDNFDFTYLSSEQHSADLHTIVTALKQTDLFPGQWMSTGVSKSGITTALYAYYDELNGWNDIDVYVPFCAPFMMTLDNVAVGDFIEQGALGDMPELKQRIFDIGRLAAEDSEAGAKFRELIVKNNIGAEIDASQLSESEIKGYVCSALNTYMSNLFSRLSYINIDSWKDLIPDPNSNTLDLDELHFFMLASDREFDETIAENKKKVSTRAEISEERRIQFLNMRRADAGWPYYVQAVLELGTYAFSYSFLEDCKYITKQDMLNWQKDNLSSNVEYPEYVSRYNGKMMEDFLKNLNTTKKKMVFVYGGNDPWTGAAVPNSVTSNPNVKKFIIPHGTHNDDILSDEKWGGKGEEIIDAMNAFLTEMQKK